VLIQPDSFAAARLEMAAIAAGTSTATTAIPFSVTFMGTPVRMMSP
jgi:hypothetical protein